MTSTEKPSAASANIYHLRGRNSEAQVKEHYIKCGYKFIEERWRSVYAEVDLVFYKPGEALVFVEVKSGRFENAPVLLGPSQAKRLSRLVVLFSQFFPTEVHLAIVSQDGSIRVFKDPLCDLLSF